MIVIENRNLTDWVNCRGSGNGDVVVWVDGYVQGRAPVGSAYRMRARAGSHTVSLTRQPGNYCWLDPVDCSVEVTVGKDVTILVTGNERITCPK